MDLAARAAPLRMAWEADAQDSFGIVPGPKSRDLVKREIHRYSDLFSDRQLLYLLAAKDALSDVESEIRLNFALLVSTSLEFNSMLCGYKGAGRSRPGAIRHTFSHHAYSFPHTALENNPVFLAEQSGTLQNLFADRIRRGRQWAEQPREKLFTQNGAKFVAIGGEIGTGIEVGGVPELKSGRRRFFQVHGSSARLPIEDEQVDFVITDPPYFDSVQYSDLSQFFRVWLAWLLPDIARWDYDMGGSAVGMTGANDAGHYRDVLAGIFKEARRVLKSNSGRLIFTFHHWSPKGWSALTQALLSAQWVLMNAYVVHSENTASVHIANLKALTHDAVLVLAPRHMIPAKSWEPVGLIRRDDSSHFCEDCAAALGWALSAQLDDEAVSQMWDRLLASTPG